MRKKRFSDFSLRDALAFLGITDLPAWPLQFTPRPPSAHCRATLEKLAASFDLSASEAAKSLVIDAVLLDAAERFTALKIWKEAALQTDQVKGTVDYLIAPQARVFATPLLCVVEAKKDDFERGLAQCLVEMAVCRRYNQQAGLADSAIYGIVTNAKLWQFYQLTALPQVLESPAYAETRLPDILGILDMIFTDCANRVKREQRT